MGHNARILYVEDNDDHAELVLRCLATHGVRDDVLHLSDGEAALAYLARCERGDVEQPDVLLLDLRLPKVDGFEILRTVKEHAKLRSIPVVVLSTSAKESDLRRAYAHHANSYLVKPEEFTDLDNLLRDVSTYWLSHNARVVRDGSSQVH
jgi:CheY-like chemotaxis protein